MFDRLTIHSSRLEYEVRFVADFVAELSNYLRPGDYLVIDDNVRKLFGVRLESILANVGHLSIIPSEEQKSFQALDPFIDSLLESGFRKNNRLVAVGGGITQDVVAFTASILFRGVEWAYFPTTLIAQCDSCIGSKTSINFGRYKNQLGGFYPPQRIFIDLEFLTTLSDMDFRSGLGEMMHYYLVAGEDDFERAEREFLRASGDRALLGALVRRSLEIKKKYVELDEFDTGPRVVFNYGHSFGHAVESITNYRVPHGIAVAFGMDIANYLSVKLGHLPEEVRSRIRPALENIWGDIHLDEVDTDGMLRALGKDKKNSGSQINVILTRGMGQMFKSPLENNSCVRGWLEEVLSTMKG